MISLLKKELKLSDPYGITLILLFLRLHGSSFLWGIKYHQSLAGNESCYWELQYVCSYSTCGSIGKLIQYPWMQLSDNVLVNCSEFLITEQ